MNPQQQPRFEEQVRSAAGSRLNGHLSSATAPDGSRILVGVLVRTAVPLSPGGNAAIRETLEEVRLADGRAVLQVRFEVASGLPDSYEIHCQPITNAAAPPDSLRPRQRPLGQDHLLTLSYGALRFDYLLAPGSPWWPLSRPDSRQGGAGFLLPQSMSSVPSGRLVELRLESGQLLVRRTWERPDITVAVNGVALHPMLSDGMPVAPHGQITYWDDKQRQICALDCTLTGWVPATPIPAGPPDPGDGTCHVVSLTVGTESRPLHIAPPKPADRAVDRKFPIPSATIDGRPYYLDVQVLYTTGTWQGGEPEKWHVKIYRCATPQHAGQLRRYLRTQASLIDKVNAAVGGTGHAPPWAVAPVTVIGTSASPRATRFHVSEQEVSADPENRLSAWSGVPGQPQPNCFVIVVSPMLRKVGWANSALWAGAPGVDQLRDLKTLAVGLDKCHELGIAHCDVKPENVCRNVRADDGSSYILIDGDAVCRTREQLVDLRLTHTYASPRIVAQWRRSYDGTTEADLREHDRFGFALVVLAAVAGVDRVAALLVQDEHGERPVDSPGIVTAAIESYWPARWSGFAAALAGPFQHDALVGDEQTAVAWLERLTELATAPIDRPAVQPDAAQVSRGVHAPHLDQIRQEVRERPRGLNAWVPAVIDRVAAHQLVVARAAYWKTVRLWGLVPLLIGVILLVGAVVGR